MVYLIPALTQWSLNSLLKKDLNQRSVLRESSNLIFLVIINARMARAFSSQQRAFCLQQLKS